MPLPPGVFVAYGGGIAPPGGNCEIWGSNCPPRGYLRVVGE